MQLGIDMPRLRTRQGDLPGWARSVNRFALAFLLMATCRAVLPQACGSLATILDQHACCAHTAHHADGNDAPQPPISPVDAHGAEFATDATPCNHVAIAGSYFQPLSYARLPLLHTPRHAAPTATVATPQHQPDLDRAHPLRGPPIA